MVVSAGFETTVQVNVCESVPDVTVTEPDFSPAVEYVFCTFAVVPERPSVPLQE